MVRWKKNVFGLIYGAHAFPKVFELHAFLFLIISLSCMWFFFYLLSFSIAGKEMGSYYWHGRDTATTRELNPKVLI